MRKCTQHSDSWWQPGNNNTVHVGGAEFHSNVHIQHVIENEKRAAEEKARKMSEVCV